MIGKDAQKLDPSLFMRTCAVAMLNIAGVIINVLKIWH